MLLVDAGGTGVGVAADRVLGVAEGDADVTRPPWTRCSACSRRDSGGAGVRLQDHSRRP